MSLLLQINSGASNSIVLFLCSREPHNTYVFIIYVRLTVVDRSAFESTAQVNKQIEIYEGGKNGPLPILTIQVQLINLKYLLESILPKKALLHIYYLKVYFLFVKLTTGKSTTASIRFPLEQ
jgi:hypothetical protein